MTETVENPPLPNRFVPEPMGSATHVALDAHTELHGYQTEAQINPRIQGTDHVNYMTSKGAPWGLRDSLVDMTRELGIPFDAFIERIAENRSDTEMAGEFAVSPHTIQHLKNHFYRHGINDVQGQD
ncbi:hypothetical protein [Heliophilum fasciatum]|uniref:Uncharacterized protein n=1 Tax=Heliophilum fasciatum TaxID=35700 RepID=A0A4R2RCB3_9FIRM|nr:hypothetical protein [Heliophilum fasciatum]MCW2279151.1 hypothetical protein [Heliophilum fasciatum]TCP61010.1 hypothetical protein EDD73_1312 [Heliophilum fasciatum]